MITLHLLALLLHRIKGERGIVRAMDTGCLKTDQPPPIFLCCLLVRALLCVIIATGCVWAAITFI
jgi:hypothetical protein